MRKTLLAAVALAPLCLVLAEGPAVAQDTISSSVSTPIATATASNGAPADIDIAAGGSVTVSGTIPAVTLNSSNNVTNDGSISIKDVTTGTAVAPTTGVLLQGGNTGNFSNVGSLGVIGSYTATDTVNKDGIVEAPFAQGSYRDGVRLAGSGALVGSISNVGSITVNGDASYGISIEAPLTGNLSNSGTISLTGDNGAALRSLAPISGGVSLTGGVTALGQGSSAVSLLGGVGGGVSLYSGVSATGYSTVTRSVNDSELAKVQATPTDVQQAGAAMIVGGGVGSGIFIGTAPVGTNTTTVSTTDLDGDGIADYAEGAGSITAYGNQPALQIGVSGANTVIGNFVGVNGGADESNGGKLPGAATANDYGLIVRGSVAAYGTYDGVAATALQIGAADGTGSVNMGGGVRVVGAINASSYDADATGIHLTAGGSSAEIRNEGFIESTVNHSTLDTTGSNATAATAYGILIDPGATAPKLTNYGFLTASGVGDNASAAAVLDKSGSVNSVLNEGEISASLSPGVAGNANSGTLTALDLSANTSGVSLVQQANPAPISVLSQTTTSSSGVTTTTSATTSSTSGTTITASSSTTASTTTTTVTTTASGVTTTTISTTPTTPSIVGDVRLGSGRNSVQLLAGSLIGALDLGSGASGENSSFIIDNTSGVSSLLTTFDGPLTYRGTGLTLGVNNGVLINTSPTTLNLSSLTVGSSGLLYAAINPAAGTNTLYDASSGSATLASGARLGIVLQSTLPTDTTYTIIKAGTLNNANADASVLGDVPYLVNATATTNATAGVISVALSNKTAAQLGLNPGESAALTPVLASLGNDAAIEGELLGQYSKSGFLGVYDQLLPDYSGGVFQLASAASDAITRATSRTNDIENPGGTRGAWAQEFALGVDRPRGASPGYQGEGFGFVGGLEAGGAGLGAFGVTGAFVAGDLRDPHLPGEAQQSISEGELGGYWQAQLGGFRADARLAGGYLYFSDRRELYEANASTGTITLDRNAKGSGRGWSATGHFGAAYQFDFGKWYVRPSAQGDYFKLYEGGFTEHGAAGSSGHASNGYDGFDLTLAARNGDQAAGQASVTIGGAFGTGFVFRPELQLGYRDVFSGTAGDTTARFTGGQNFTLAPAAITGGGPVARFGLKGDTDFYELDFQAGAESRDKFTEADVRLNVRVLF